MILNRLTMSSPMGELTLISDGNTLKSVQFYPTGTENGGQECELLILAKRQLEEYFSGERRIFELPLSPEGTEFQQKVWQQVGAVNFGETKSYVEIALSLGSEKYSRAVGMANGKNPIPIIIPCHRIIGHDGKLTGYSGGLDRKKWLLLHEQQVIGKAGLLF